MLEILEARTLLAASQPEAETIEKGFFQDTVPFALWGAAGAIAIGTPLLLFKEQLLLNPAIDGQKIENLLSIPLLTLEATLAASGVFIGGATGLALDALQLLPSVKATAMMTITLAETQLVSCAASAASAVLGGVLGEFIGIERGTSWGTNGLIWGAIGGQMLLPLFAYHAIQEFNRGNLEIILQEQMPTFRPWALVELATALELSVLFTGQHEEVSALNVAVRSSMRTGGIALLENIGNFLHIGGQKGIWITEPNETSYFDHPAVMLPGLGAFVVTSISLVNTALQGRPFHEFAQSAWITIGVESPTLIALGVGMDFLNKALQFEGKPSTDEQITPTEPILKHTIGMAGIGVGAGLFSGSVIAYLTAAEGHYAQAWKHASLCGAGSGGIAGLAIGLAFDMALLHIRSYIS